MRTLLCLINPVQFSLPLLPALPHHPGEIDHLGHHRPDFGVLVSGPLSQASWCSSGSTRQPYVPETLRMTGLPLCPPPHLFVQKATLQVLPGQCRVTGARERCQRHQQVPLTGGGGSMQFLFPFVPVLYHR